MLCGSFLGFGALLQASGHSAFEGILLTLTVWALPGQVVLLSSLDAGAGFLTIAFAVTLTAVRLMPMVVAILPEMRHDGHPRWQYFLVAHFTAATVWLEARRHFPAMPVEERLAFMIGLGSTLVGTMCCMLVVGMALSGHVPLLLSSALVFLTPCYFFTGLLAGADEALDYVSIFLGCVIFVAVHAVLPQFDMMIAGLVGGTLAYFFAQRRRKATDDE